MSAPMLAASAQRRVASLASMIAVHRAFRWVHLHQPKMLEWLLAIVRVPAPPFGESRRGEWFLEAFRTLGLTNVRIDEVGNVLGEIAPPGKASSGPVLLISAHLDTVFPEGTPCEPTVDPKSTRIEGPGVCDNGAGLSGLLGLAAAIRDAEIVPPAPILFVANVGEEGEGDLRGMRHLFEGGAYASRIATSIVLEGSGSSTVVTRGLGSLRFRARVSGPGGHSWTDANVANPIFLLSRALAELSHLQLPEEPRTILNAGSISGGTSVNSVPESASVLLDLRSTDPEQLRETAALLERTLTRSIQQSNQANGGQQAARLSFEVIGDRPASALPDDAPILDALRAVDRHLGIRTEPRIGSTDANIPLSLGVPAIALGTGGTGGGIHTLGEWYDPAGREVAMRRILLLVLDTVQQLDDLSRD